MQEITTIQARIRRCLDRLGYTGIGVVDMGEGHFLVTGQVPTPNDRAVVLATTRCVIGVVKVKSKIKVARKKS